MTRLRNVVVWLLVGLLLAACASFPPPLVIPAPEAVGEGVATAEVEVVEIPLAGPAAERDAEISAMAWYGDNLILVPQYPDRWGNNLFALLKADIVAFLDGSISGPLTPQEVALEAPGITDLPGYQGLEAITFRDAQVFVTIETEQGDGMMGYLLTGRVQPDLSAVVLDTGNMVELQPQAPLDNFTDETLLVSGDTVLTFYEANGANVNPDAVAHVFDVGLNAAGTVPMTNIEYRVTDATTLDDAGRFWVINYLFPGELEKLDPAPDVLVEKYGEGPTHAQNEGVERLVELQLGADGISLVDAPPIQLELLGDDSLRNWEGIVRLDDRGFLLATDKYPVTILGFVSMP